MTRLAGSHLFEVYPPDPVAFAAVQLTLVAIGLLASWLPALHASRIDPASARDG